MEKSQKEIEILTKGGKEVTLRIREIFPLTDDQLTRLVDNYLPGYLTQWGSDDDLDYEPYATIFNFLTGRNDEHYYTNLFYSIEDEDLEDELDNGFTYNGKEYEYLMDLVDEWLNTNYPKAFATGLSILRAWEYWEASNYTEADMLFEIAHKHLGADLANGWEIQPQTIKFINGYKGESYMKNSKYITYEIEE